MTGLSPRAMIIMGLILIALIVLSIRLIQKSRYRMISVVGFIIFALLIPCGLILSKNWIVDKTQMK